MDLKKAEKLNELRTELVRQGRLIETESFSIIEKKVGEHNFSPEEWDIVKRVVHTTGDFDYANILRFSNDAVEAGKSALMESKPIFTDTRMVAVGLSPWRLEWFGTSVETPIRNADAQKLAEEWGITRSAAAFRIVSSRIRDSIVAIGNAPTALLEVIRLIKEDGIKPALVVGVPVGFVQAVESKELLSSVNVPYITVLGTKGGSTVAVAILHGLMDCAKESK